MKSFKEDLLTEIRKEYDVVVAGGGVAGIAAALSAARAGAKVTLIEKGYMLGGLATAGLVTIYLPLCDGKGNQVSFGISEELLKLSMRHGYENMYPKPWLEGGSVEEKKKTRFQVQYNAQLFAIDAERRLLMEGVDILYGTMICSVHMNKSKIDAIVVENKSGRYAISVESVVDTTGDADICKFAEEDTEIFKQGNILAAWYYGINKKGYELNMLGFSDTPDKDKTGNEPKPLIDRRFTGLDADEISEMVQLSHTAIIENVVKNQKDDETHMPVTIATIPQIRMTRRLDGMYTMDDTEMHTYIEDSIGMVGDWRKVGPVYELPFRLLYGKKVDNLITAGRCISVTDAMWDITRVIPVCAVTGEAAGAAAAMTNDFKKLDVKKLQDYLEKRGVKLHE